MVVEVLWTFKLTLLFNLKGNCKIDSLDASEALVSTKLIIKASDNNCINVVKLN